MVPVNDRTMTTRGSKRVYFRENIFSREVIFAGRYFRGKIFSRIGSYSRKYLLTKIFQIHFSRNFPPAKIKC